MDLPPYDRRETEKLDRFFYNESLRVEPRVEGGWFEVCSFEVKGGKLLFIFENADDR